MTPQAESFDIPPERFVALGNEVVQLMTDALAAERKEPVLRPATGSALRAALDEPLPKRGCSPEEILAIWRDEVAPYCRRNGHPRFFGYVCTSADPWGMLADAMASALNQPVTAWRSAPSATEIERLVVRWLDDLVGFDGGGAGLLVSGGSMANLHGIACAVTHAEERAKLPSGSRGRLTLYQSTEGHVSIRKAARLLGFAEGHVRRLPIDDHRRMRPEDLRSALDEDFARGLVPAVVCASSGTANAGTIDPLEALASVCAEHDVWFHVDGSYGGPAAIVSDHADLRRAFAKADSVSLDPHKWLFAPADVGCILLRDDDVARRTFAWFSEYTEVVQTNPIERYAAFDYGLEMSRRFRGLKVWTILKARGADAIRATIERNIELRRLLDARVRVEPRLERLASDLSISCFRYVPVGAPGPAEIDRVNRHIVETLVGEGRCYMSPTTLDGRFALRVCIVNFRTQPEDIHFLVDEVLRLGDAAGAPTP